MNANNPTCRAVLVSDFNKGGAATSLRRLLRGLLNCGFSARWVHNGSWESDSSTLASWPPIWLLLLSRVLYRFPALDETVRCRGSSQSLRKYLAKCRPEIVNLHNLHDAFPPSVLDSLPQQGAMVWTLHDMWLLTGYCCYSYGCKKYEGKCTGECPQANRWGRTWETPAEGWMRRERFFQRNLDHLAWVSPSRWLAGCAKARLPPHAVVKTIPYGIPIDVFMPLGSKSAVRMALGLPVGGRIILCGSQVADDPRKGTRQLVAAIGVLNESARWPVNVVAFGHQPEGGRLPSEWIHTGTIRDEALLNLYYNAADVFVLPSLADNLPNTLIEATAAGTPCVTFEVGGCPEIVRDGETGFVARAGDVNHLAECIERVLTMGEERRREMSAACRRVAVAEYDVKLQAQRYVELFEEMVERGTGRL